MADQIVHRGPDDSGVWVDQNSGVALGFRRLAILDLSPAGHQPMLSASGRFVVVFNGEVYNFLELREELESKSHRFHGHSDTEVMLAAISEYGLEPAVGKFVGMFAFAVWDRAVHSLHLVRDRLGIKPLYYGWIGRTFLFASELKAMRAHPAFVAEIDRDALALQIRHNYIPSPYSIFKGIRKLPPGCILSVRAGQNGRPEPSAYWSFKSVVEHGIASPSQISEGEAIEELDALLRKAVRQRMVADVPLGAFLSGGIDSSTVVGIMQSQSSRPVKTFSIGFQEDEYNEAQHAKEVAAHLRTDHTELYVTPEGARAVIPRLPLLYDEPFSDSSQIPTFLVSELARRHVTVSLSGDGGDELFGGYNRYFVGMATWRKVGWLPKSARLEVARAIMNVRPRTWDALFNVANNFLPSNYRVRLPGAKMHRLAEVLPAETAEDFYRILASHWSVPEQVVIGANHSVTAFDEPSLWTKIPNFTRRMMFLDTITYLPDDILVKVDRSSMGVSLEARVPLLDHRVVEFTTRIPLPMKIRGSHGKWILRQVLYRYVPKHLVERPKMGFGVPINDWIRGPLRDWAEDLLSEERLKREGFFRPEPIRKKWSEHLGGQDWQYYLWDVLMFQAWRDHWARSESQGKSAT